MSELMVIKGSVVPFWISMPNFGEAVLRAEKILKAIKSGQDDELSFNAMALCDEITGARDSRVEWAEAHSNGRWISAKIKHSPRPPHPPVSNPREFDTTIFMALMLAELVGWRLTFQWLPGPGPGRYYLRGDMMTPSGGGREGQRVYIARVIVDANIAKSAFFDDDHHSYKRADLIQRAGGSLGKGRQGKYGREHFIKLSRESYEKRFGADDHAKLPPDRFEALLRKLFAAADDFAASVH